MTNPRNSTDEPRSDLHDARGQADGASGREGDPAAAQFAETVAFCEDQILRGALHRPIFAPGHKPPTTESGDRP
jgi:hypothetical protein